jgi:hypothetical protein
MHFTVTEVFNAVVKMTVFCLPMISRSRYDVFLGGCEYHVPERFFFHFVLQLGPLSGTMAPPVRHCILGYDRGVRGHLSITR